MAKIIVAFRNFANAPNEKEMCSKCKGKTLAFPVTIIQNTRAHYVDKIQGFFKILKQVATVL